MKTCNECGQLKPNSEYFSAPSYQCKDCKREIGRARYAPIKAATKSKRLKAYRNGLKKCNTCGHYKPVGEYGPHAVHWDRLAHRCKACVSKKGKEHYIANREKQLERGKKYYREHKESHLARCSQWRRDHPDKSHAIWHRYRSHKLDTGGSFTSEQWHSLVEFYSPDGRCLCCHKNRKLHKDHVIPLSKGGTNTIGNIQPICHSCNSKKHTHDTDHRPDAGAFARSLVDVHE